MISEGRAFGAAVAAGLLVVGGAFGVSALLRRFAPAPPGGMAERERSGFRTAANTGGMPGMPEGGTSSGASRAGAGTLVTAGRTLFAGNCARCHGNGAKGGFGPGLRGTGLSEERIAAIIMKGVPGRMPAYANKLKESEVAALAAYVRSLKK